MNLAQGMPKSRHKLRPGSYVRPPRRTWQYSPLAPQQVEVYVNCIRPWTLNVHWKQVMILSLTSIDPVTNLIEINHFQGKASTEVSQVFDNNWLAWDPHLL